MENKRRSTIIVINGRGGSGKDTFITSACNVASSLGYKTESISSIDPYKQVAKKLGWDSNNKTDEDRKFLSDLKRLSDNYNNYSTNYCIHEAVNAAITKHRLVFVQIREWDNIQRFVNWMNTHFTRKVCVVDLCTVLIKNPNIADHGNDSDDHAEDHEDKYDYVFINNNTLDAWKIQGGFFTLNLLGKEVAIERKRKNDESDSNL